MHLVRVCRLFQFVYFSFCNLAAEALLAVTASASQGFVRAKSRSMRPTFRALFARSFVAKPSKFSAQRHPKSFSHSPPVVSVYKLLMPTAWLLRALLTLDRCFLCAHALFLAKVRGTIPSVSPPECKSKALGWPTLWQLRPSSYSPFVRELVSQMLNRSTAMLANLESCLHSGRNPERRPSPEEILAKWMPLTSSFVHWSDLIYRRPRLREIMQQMLDEAQEAAQAGNARRVLTLKHIQQGGLYHANRIVYTSQ